MDKRIKLYNLLKGLGKLYIQIRANPSTKDIVKEINHYVFLLEMKVDYGESIEPYYKATDKFINGWFLKNKYTQYDYKTAVLYNQVFIIANYALAEHINNNKFDKARTMASSLHNLPDFLLGEYAEKDSKKFYDEHICFYTRVHGDKSLAAFEPLFYGELNKQNEVINIRIKELKKFYQRKPIDEESYSWEVACCVYSESENFRAVVLKKSENCFNIRYEQLLYDMYVDYWYWAECNNQINTFVESAKHAEQIIYDEFKIIDYKYEGDFDIFDR